MHRNICESVRNTCSFRLDGNNGFEQFRVHCIAVLSRKAANVHGKLGPSVAELLQKSVEDGNSERTVSKDSFKQQPFSACSPCMQC